MERLFTLNDIPGVLWSPAMPPEAAPGRAVHRRHQGTDGGRWAHRPVRRAPQRRAGGAGRPEWQATLDALQDLDDVGADGPVGFWGVAPGTAIGVPFAAAEPRITAAVFGLAGHETLAEAAAKVTIPVEFLLQWDDELVPRDSHFRRFWLRPAVVRHDP